MKDPDTMNMIIKMITFDQVKYVSLVIYSCAKICLALWVQLLSHSNWLDLIIPLDMFGFATDSLQLTPRLAYKAMIHGYFNKGNIHILLYQVLIFGVKPVSGIVMISLCSIYAASGHHMY